MFNYIYLHIELIFEWISSLWLIVRNYTLRGLTQETKVKSFGPSFFFFQDAIRDLGFLWNMLVFGGMVILFFKKAASFMYSFGKMWTQLEVLKITCFCVWQWFFFIVQFMTRLWQCHFFAILVLEYIVHLRV